jgi:hypothetical protein
MVDAGCLFAFEGSLTYDANYSGVGVSLARQDAGLLPARPDSGNYLSFYAVYLKRSRQQEPTPCLAFLGGSSPLPVGSAGAIILSCKKYPDPSNY